MKDSKNQSLSTEKPAPVSPLITADGQPFDIPEEGTLGILAMGYAGIMLWRQKRHKASSLLSFKQVTV